MKALILVALLSISTMAFANTTIPAATDAAGMNVLGLVIGLHQSYSVDAELDLKVIELLAGDGMNATRMVVVLNDGLYGTKIFELGEMMVEVKSAEFKTKDTLVINYTQDSFDNADDMNPITVNKTMTIQIKRNPDNTIADEITVLE